MGFNRVVRFGVSTMIVFGGLSAGDHSMAQDSPPQLEGTVMIEGDQAPPGVGLIATAQRPDDSVECGSSTTVSGGDYKLLALGCDAGDIVVISLAATGDEADDAVVIGPGVQAIDITFSSLPGTSDLRGN